MQTTNQIDIAVPIEYICRLLGLPEVTNGVYHSQKTNTLFIRIAQNRLNNPCYSCEVRKETPEAPDSMLKATVYATIIPKHGGLNGEYPRYQTSDFKTKSYVAELADLGWGLINPKDLYKPKCLNQNQGFTSKET